jgi:uncharacterized protein YoxC
VLTTPRRLSRGMVACWFSLVDAYRAATVHTPAVTRRSARPLVNAAAMVASGAALPGDLIRARRPGNCASLSEGDDTVVGMASTGERLRTLEVRVDNLETWAGPGQAGALAGGQRELRADLDKVRQTQDRHTRMLADLISDVSGLKSSVSVLESGFGVLRADVAGLKTDMGIVQSDVAGLKTDVAELKTDVATLKTDVAELKTDVAGLKTDVAGLKTDMAEVKGTVREILRRLPAPPAGT